MCAMTHPLIHMCVTTHLCVMPMFEVASFIYVHMYVTTHWLIHTCSYVCHDSSTCVSCQFSKQPHSYMVICVWWLIDSFIHVHMCLTTHTLIHMRVMTHSYACHDSSICVSCQPSKQPHSYIFICVSWLIHVCVSWLIHMCVMPNVEVISFMYVSWSLSICVSMTHSYVSHNYCSG